MQEAYIDTEEANIKEATVNETLRNDKHINIQSDKNLVKDYAYPKKVILTHSEGNPETQSLRRPVDSIRVPVPIPTDSYLNKTSSMRSMVYDDRNLQRTHTLPSENPVPLESHIQERPYNQNPFMAFYTNTIALSKDGNRALNPSKHHTVIEKPSGFNFEDPLPRPSSYSPEPLQKITNNLYPDTLVGAENRKSGIGLQHSMIDNLSTTENIKVRVFAEYFSMIEDLVLVADKKFNLIANNHTSRNVNTIVTRIKKRFNQHYLSKSGSTLDQIFQELPNDQLQCMTNTVSSLLNIYTMFDYKKNKFDPFKIIEFREAKIERILKVLERFDNGVRISNKQDQNANKETKHKTLKKLHRLKSSMRALPINKDNVVVSDLSDIEL